VLDNTRFLYLNPGEVEVYPRLRLFNFFVDMKIINATLNNDTITITLDAKANVHKIYLDSIINQKNMYSDEDDKHTHVISDFVT
jgi:hypothetical protein